MMVAHGVSSPGMFSIANYNYEELGTRNLLVQKGFLYLQPVAGLLWFLLLCANMAAPPALSLVSEVFIVVRILKLGY